MSMEENQDSTKVFCEHGKTPNISGQVVTCEICLYNGIANTYQKMFAEATSDANEMRRVVNFYKTLMFTVDASKEQVTANINEMAENYPFESSLLPMIPTWEKLDPEVIYEAVRLHEMFYNKFAEIAFKTKSKHEIKEHHKKKTKDGMDKILTDSAEREIKREEKAKALTPYWKMVRSYVKTLNMTEEQAMAQLAKLNVTEESMKGK